jgi:hypothetical protein
MSFKVMLSGHDKFIAVITWPFNGLIWGSFLTVQGRKLLDAAHIRILLTFILLMTLVVAPLYVATPLNVALAAKCRTIAAQCRNRR